MSFPGIQPHICGHAGEEDVLAGLQGFYSDGLPLEVADGADAIRPKELEAADMDPCQDDDGVPCLQPDDERASEGQGDVSLTGGHSLHGAGPCRGLDVVDLGEPFAPQELFSHVLGGDTEAGDLDQSDLRCLRRRLRGHWLGIQAEQPHRPR
jgi:hypothetical protein